MRQGHPCKNLCGLRACNSGSKVAPLSISKRIKLARHFRGRRVTRGVGKVTKSSDKIHSLLSPTVSWIPSGCLSAGRGGAYLITAKWSGPAARRSEALLVRFTACEKSFEMGREGLVEVLGNQA